MLHTSQLVKLHYAPDIFSAEDLAKGSTMANTIHQHGSGDNISGDKVLGDKVAGNKIGNQINGGNIANVVNEAKDQTQVSATGFSQTTGTSTAELLALTEALRQAFGQLPAALQEDLILDLEDVEAEIQKPAEQRHPVRLKKRLERLLVTLATASGLMVGGLTTANALADQVIELGSKVGLELPQLPPQP